MYLKTDIKDLAGKEVGLVGREDTTELGTSSETTEGLSRDGNRELEEEERSPHCCQSGNEEG